MRHEPCSSVGTEAQHPPKLVRRNSLFAGRHEMDSQQPFVHRDMRPLENRSDGRGERLIARTAVIDARAMGFALHGSSFAYNTAVGAFRAIRPAGCLEVFPGSF